MRGVCAAYARVGDGEIAYCRARDVGLIVLGVATVTVAAARSPFHCRLIVSRAWAAAACGSVLCVTSWMSTWCSALANANGAV
jgi:hypothetical protein